MNQYIIIKLILALTYLGNSPVVRSIQENFEKVVNLKNGQTVFLELKFANDIKVVSWDKPVLSVKANVEHNFKEPLDFQLLEQNSSDEVQIEEKVKNLENHKSFNTNGKNADNDCLQLKIDYEVFLPSNTVLKINSISGNIEIKNMNNAMNIETISGFVDIEINSSNRYDLACSTISGEIYSDLNFDYNKVKEDIVGSKLNTRYNGGGTKLKLQSISGDLFIRKK